VAGTGLAHDSIVSPLNAMASEARQVKDEHCLDGNRARDQDPASGHPKNRVRSASSSSTVNGLLVLDCPRVFPHY